MTSIQTAVSLLADRLELILNETEEELGRPLDDAEVQSISNEFLSALDEDEEEASHPDVTTANASHFATCKRDEKGYCLPGEGGGGEGAKDEKGAKEAADGGDEKVKPGIKEKMQAAVRATAKALNHELTYAAMALALLPFAPVASVLLGGAAIFSAKQKEVERSRKAEATGNSAPPDLDDVTDKAMDLLKQLYEIDGKEMPDIDPAEVKAAIAKEMKKAEKKETTDNQETPSMTRNDTVAWLVANCDCLRHKGRVLANEDAFSDDDLARLKATTEADKKRERALNAVQQTTGVDLIANASSDDDMMAKCKELMAKEETAEGETTANRHVLSDNEWLATAPPRIRTVVKNALAQQEAERQNLMAQLRDIAANTASPTRKSIIESRLRGNPAVESLRDIMALVQPEATHNAQAFGLGYPSYAGAAPSPHSPYALTDNEQADVLDLEAIRAEQDAREQQKRAN